MRRLLFALLSGLLLYASWPTSPLFPLIFVGFVPLFFIENATKGLRLFGFIYLALLIWNVLTTWWIWNASPGGAVAAILLNALLMTFPFLLFHKIKRHVSEKIAFISFVFFWLSFEYIHLSWEFTWPWLTLGNVFAMYPNVVQWYEYTGVLGGSLWILIMNVLFYFAFRELRYKKYKRFIYNSFLLLLIGGISFFIEYNDEKKKIEVVVVQPNIDPYNEKFESDKNFIPFEKQLEILIQTSESVLTDSTMFLLWPETAFPKGYWEHTIHSYPLITEVKKFIHKYPSTTLITGADTYVQYKSKETGSTRFTEGIGFYDVFNTAMKVSSNDSIEFYHKSKLVPGVERMPYPGIFTFLEYLAIDLGGVYGSLGIQPNRKVFYSNDKIGMAPSICYESVFGGFMTEYIRKGAHFIGIITNDGWWGNTPGHEQHFHYARLRAIEQRRWVARSANTGISGFIDSNGNFLNTLSWWKRGAIKQNININTYQTFYSRFGDYIGRLSIFMSVILILSVGVKRILVK